MTHAASSASSTATAGMAARPAIALITGASRGLGRNAALHVARSGTDVILTYRSQAAEAQAVVAEIEALGRRAVALPLDVAASATFTAFAGQVRDVLARHWQRERFDFLVNNAVWARTPASWKPPRRSSTTWSTSTSRACFSSHRSCCR